MGPPTASREELVAARGAAVAARERLADTAEGMLGSGGIPADSRYWFAWTYVRTTEGALAEADAGSFADPVFVLRLVSYFEQLYIDNLRAYDRGGPAEPHWRQAFEVASRLDRWRARRARLWTTLDRPSIRSIATSVVAASRAHVRFDLPRAMVWVHRSAPSGGAAALAGRLADFMAMAAVFDRAAEAANREVADRAGAPLHRLPDRLQDLGMRFVFRADLIHERAWAWECAEALARSSTPNPNPYREPQPGRLEGDAIRAAPPDPFGALEPRLRPTMGRLRRPRADAAARRLAGAPAALSGAERIGAIQGLCHGYTGRRDERAILALLRRAAAEGELVAAVNGVGAWELAANLHGGELRQLRQLLRSHYYPDVQPSIARALIRRAERYATLPWERRMIADIRELRPELRGPPRAGGAGRDRVDFGG